MEQRHLFETAMIQWEHQGMQIGAKVCWRDEMENEIEEQESGEEPAAGIVPVESKEGSRCEVIDCGSEIAAVPSCLQETVTNSKTASRRRNIRMGRDQ